MKKPKNSVPVDKEAWSQSAKDGLDYQFHPDVYTDKKYRCWRCGTNSVFTAEDQKYTYEVRKAYTWQTRVLCERCHKQRIDIEAELKSINRQWNSDKIKLQRNLSFLQRWEFLLNELPRYRGSENPAHVKMLRKYIEEAS